MVQRMNGIVLVALGAALAACGTEPQATNNEADTEAALSTGRGLHADYFANPTLTAPVAITRTDATVNFDWGVGSPAAALPADRFSVRWSGRVEALFTETYTFYATSDDGVRVWVNGQPVVDDWTDHASSESSGTIALTAGHRYDLRVEYHETTGSALVSFSWSSPSTPKQIVPRAQLYLPFTRTTGTGGATGTVGATSGTGGAVVTATVGTGGTPAPGTGGSVMITPGTGGAVTVAPGTGGAVTVAPGTGGAVTPPPGTGGSTPIVAGTGGAATATATPPGACGTFKTIRLVGNHIQDTSGANVAARGPEMVVAQTAQTDAVDAAAAMGANALRMLLTLDAANGMTPAAFDAIIGRAVSHAMVVWISLYTWDSANNHVISSALGGGNFYSLPSPTAGTCSQQTPASCYLAVWSRQWLKDLIAKYAGHVIIDGMQEFVGASDPSSEDGRSEWAATAKTNIAWFRSAGYTEPLEIMTNFQGRDLYAIVEKGADIRTADTVLVGSDPQTMFGWQAYWAPDWYKGWQGGLLLGGSSTITGAQAIHQFAVTQPFPIEIGLDNYPDDTSVEYRAEMDQAAADKANWLWWSWTGSNTVECPNDGASCQSYVTTAQTGFAGAVRSACSQ